MPRATSRSRIRRAANTNNNHGTRNSSPLAALLLTLLTCLLSLQSTSAAGLTFGGVTSTDSCYAAFQNGKRPDENVIDKDGYVAVINELSDSAFTALGQNEAGDWGMFPVTNFNDLPKLVRDEFYTHACGGPLIICQNAFLYTDGTGTGGKVPSAQQEIYLFQVCKGVEAAIDEVKEAMAPVPAPTPPAFVTTPEPPTDPSLPVPACPPLYLAGSYYESGDTVSNRLPPTTSGVQIYNQYQCKPAPADGWCQQPAYEPGSGQAWEEAWITVGECIAVGELPAPASTPGPTPRPTFPPQPTYPPTGVSPPTAKPVDVEEVTLKLVYHAVVSPAVTAEGLNTAIAVNVMGDGEAQEAGQTVPDPPELETTLSLMIAMTTWSLMAKDNYAEFSGGGVPAMEKKRAGGTRGGKAIIFGGRRLLVQPVTTFVSIAENPEAMRIVDVECDTTNVLITQGSHCVEVSTDLTLQLVDEDPTAYPLITSFFETKFDGDLRDESFFTLIGDSGEAGHDHVRVVYPVPEVPASATPPDVEETPGEDAEETTTPASSVAPGPEPKGPDSLDRLIASNAEAEDKPKGGSNMAGIVSGVVVGLVVVGVALFIFKRKRDGAKDEMSVDSYKKREFDPANDLEGGDASRGSSRDEFSSGASQSSSSMQSYSGSESSSGSSRSGSRTSRSSRSSYTSRSSRSSTKSGSHYSSSFTSGTSAGPSRGGPASVSASEESGSHSSSGASPYSKDDQNSPNDNARNAARAAAVGRGLSQNSASESASTNSRSTNSRSTAQSGPGSLYSTGSSVDDASDPNVGSVDSHSRTSSTTGTHSHTSASHTTSSSAKGSEGYNVNVDLMENSAQDVSKSTNDDDSSAGSSGWDSSDGDSSVDTGSVDSYDPNTIRTGDLDSATTPDGSSSKSYSGDGDSSLQESEGSGSAMVNPAVNPVVQRNVTMLPITEDDAENYSSSHSTSHYDDGMSEIRSSLESDIRSSLESGHDLAPMAGDIQDAIEKGDWAAVGTTAALLAEESSQDSRSSARSNRSNRSQNRSALGGEEGAFDDATRDATSGDGLSSSIMSTGSDQYNMDLEKALEIDALVEGGDWDGVVAVAARYADEADEADSDLSRPLRNNVEGGSNGSPNSSPSSKVNQSMVSQNDSVMGNSTMPGSGGSVSVETADDTSIFSNTTRDSMSHTTYSENTSTMDSNSSFSGTDSKSPPDTDTGTRSSSITSSSYPHDARVTSSMVSGVSAVSTIDQGEKRQMNAYRAEVEALVRRVVPDEIDNVDDIMVQFSGREEELIETLRAMQEKSIAQRARAAVQRSAKKEAGRTGRESSMHSEGDSVTTDGQSVTTDGQSDGQSYTTDGQSYSRASDGQSYTTDGRSSYYSQSKASEGSITEQFAQGGTPEDDDYSSQSSRSSSDGSGTMSSYSSGGASDSRMSKNNSSARRQSIGYVSVGTDDNGIDVVETSPGLTDAIDASDWRAVGAAAEHLAGDGMLSAHTKASMTDVSGESADDLDDMIDDGDWGGIIERASTMSRKDIGIGNEDDLD